MVNPEKFVAFVTETVAKVIRYLEENNNITIEKEVVAK